MQCKWCWRIKPWSISGGAGQVCCGVVPRVWKPGLKATVEWEVDPEPGAYKDWPERYFQMAGENV
ncbi:DUF3304 domain-containing protein [Pseudomonas aeruginosa]|uniref:DUF3304 domain-containing protein n=3 Tax=Pseudomonas aeruginosa TaxID=287 RepID=UPI000F81E304|nr:DUF3304 domain-containing protein [Pseudomonas aeruginosa]EIX9395848.1 DUF3304 domain-containing protein [Pseudomonas aeruginosa]ELG5200334.1 DUF3304 domain-containing protein [Pseudomonas aeruginosa]ELL4314440.1 DUF3304 domain-containing protein [Pseudomonas aeruginosa]ELR9617550.1 DUF3304 domain-containing protein [Pseudomonas aeruginosa]EMA2620975.1 DUF3304 domain-containing protein [Pseudomonas aeruginosa]